MAYHRIGCPPVVVEDLDDWNSKHQVYALSNDRKASLDDLMGDEPSSGGKSGDEIYSEYQLMRARMVDRELWPIRVRRFATLWEKWKQDAGLVDFPDMIDMAIDQVDHAPGKPSVVIGDEAQDYDAQEITLIRKWGNSAGTLILAGDPDQAIYVWRGADPQLFFEGTVPEENRRLLAQSYRVPRKVLDVALSFRNQLTDCQPLEYHPRREDPRDKHSEEVQGEFIVSNANYQSFPELIKLAEQEITAGRTIMFIASCSYMLNNLRVALRDAGIPFSNPWRIKRGDWNPLKSSKTSIVTRILALLRPHAGVYTGENGTISARCWDGEEIRSWASVLAARGVLRRGGKKRIEGVDYTTGVVSAQFLEEVFEPEVLDELEALLDPWCQPERIVEWYSQHIEKQKQSIAQYVFSIVSKFGVDAIRKPPLCYIGTIHSVKGAEADTVVLFPDLSPAAMEEWETPAGRNSVIRTYYVGMTRARQKLILCSTLGYRMGVEIPVPARTPVLKG